MLISYVGSRVSNAKDFCYIFATFRITFRILFVKFRTYDDARNKLSLGKIQATDGRAGQMCTTSLAEVAKMPCVQIMMRNRMAIGNPE